MEFTVFYWRAHPLGASNGPPHKKYNIFIGVVLIVILRVLLLDSVM